MNNDYSPSQSPDSLDLENPSSTQLTIQHENIDEFYENEMDLQLTEIKNQFLENPPNQDTILSYHYLDSNSPLTISCDNSDDENEGNFKESSFDDIKNSLEKYFDDIENQISNELDILITYMKGQKNLFIESYLVC